MNNTLLDNSIANRLKNRLEIFEMYLSNQPTIVQPPGLLHGVMGLSIFYCHLSRDTGNDKFQKKADELIDFVYEKLNSANLSPDFENGLAGIGWAMEYLVRNRFLEADTDEILADIDDRIFRHVTFTGELSLHVTNGLLGYAFYYLSRLESCQNDILSEIFKSILDEIVNRISKLKDSGQVNFTEPAGFSLLWELPVLLLVLSKITEKGIQQNKIHQFFKELTPFICSFFPLLHINRVFLLAGINAVNAQFNLPNWKGHASLLSSNISFMEILTKEFTDRNIFMSNGMAGAYLVLQELNKQNTWEMDLREKEMWLDKILNSSVWDGFKEIEKPSPIALSILGGFSGIFAVITKEENYF